jgi:hypothetical protein
MGIEIDALLQFRNSDTEIGICGVNLKGHKWLWLYSLTMDACLHGSPSEIIYSRTGGWVKGIRVLFNGSLLLLI